MFLFFTDSFAGIVWFVFYFCCFSIVKVLCFCYPRFVGNSHLLYTVSFSCQVLFSKFVIFYDNQFFGVRIQDSGARGRGPGARDFTGDGSPEANAEGNRPPAFAGWALVT